MRVDRADPIGVAIERDAELGALASSPSRSDRRRSRAASDRGGDSGTGRRARSTAARRRSRAGDRATTAVGPPAPLPASTTTLQRRCAELQLARPRDRGTAPMTSRECIARAGCGASARRASSRDLVAQRRDRRAVQRLGAEHQLEAVVLGRVVAAGDHHRRRGRRGDAPRSTATGVGTTPMSMTSAWTRRPSVSAANSRGECTRGVAADDDRAWPRPALPSAVADRADGRVVEVALGDAADVVLAKAARVHALTGTARARAPERASTTLRTSCACVLPDHEDRVAALDDDEIGDADRRDQGVVVGDDDVAACRRCDHRVADDACCRSRRRRARAGSAAHEPTSSQPTLAGTVTTPLGLLHDRVIDRDRRQRRIERRRASPRSRRDRAHGVRRSPAAARRARRAGARAVTQNMPAFHR